MTSASVSYTHLDVYKRQIINNSFDAGDDGICIKSGKDEQGRKRGEPCQNVIVMNNTVLHGHGGFVVGSEMSEMCIRDRYIVLFTLLYGSTVCFSLK